MSKFASKGMQERLAEIKKRALSIVYLSQEADQVPLDEIGAQMDFIDIDLEAIKVYVNGVRLELQLGESP